MISITIASLSFFNPSVRLESGRNVKILGKGPPVVFATGLYGTVPYQFYNTIINECKKELSMVVFDDVSPIMKKDVEEAADAIGAQRVGFLSHSSLDIDILTSDRIEKAMLHDPITLPQLSLIGLETSEVETQLDVTVVNAENLLNGKVPLPAFNIPIIEGNCNYITDMDVGHSDMLDPFWAGTARRFPLWNSDIKKSSFLDYENWKFKKISDESLMKDYHKNVSKRIKELFKEKPKSLKIDVVTN
mgnify:CR=1 FL=1|tara:strand:- start:4436 stop:5173 length:738 start_codon:yes stop_codon:yes gene_type:complete